MANGKKNYFRHSFFAGSDPKIVELISKHGKQAYFHFFRLLELCGQQAEEEVPEKFVFHARTLCAELLVTRSRLGHHLLAMQSSLLLHYVLTDSKVEILVPNLAKYLGKYTNKKSSNMPNKRKEKEIKENEMKVKIEAETSIAQPPQKPIPEKSPLIEMWNSMAQPAGLKTIEVVNDKRKKKIKASEKEIPGLNWKEYFESIPGKDYLMGKANNGFKVTFDFAIESTNVLKTLEGNYDKCFVSKVNQSKNVEESHVMKLLSANPFND